MSYLYSSISNIHLLSAAQPQAAGSQAAPSSKEAPPAAHTQAAGSQAAPASTLNEENIKNLLAMMGQSMDQKIDQLRKEFDQKLDLSKPLQSYTARRVQYCSEWSTKPLRDDGILESKIHVVLTEPLRTHFQTFSPQDPDQYIYIYIYMYMYIYVYMNEIYLYSFSHPHVYVYIHIYIYSLTLLG